jgi:bifunctional DNase/RNase
VLKLSDKSVPVFVDGVVALSIREALGGEAPARPLSHDLMHTMLDALGAKVTRAVITLRERIYRAELTVTIAGTEKVFDARSSDAIALALRFKAPIFVDSALIDAAGVEPPPPEPKPNAT